MGTYLVILYIFSFLECVFSGVTLALVYPVNTELTDRPVQSFSTTINSGAGYSYRVIKFGPLVTFCVLIYFLGNVISPKLAPQLSPLLF